jgi:ABC-type phosphate transport system substrate-binding protein
MSVSGKRGLRSGRRRLLALAMTLALSTGGLGALAPGGAVALGEQCSGANAGGVGGFLQQGATFVWKEDFNSDSHPLACNGSQGSGGAPNIFYSPQSSGGALNAWGAFDGVFHDKTAKFLAPDEPPAGPVKEEGTQLNRMTNAIGSDVAVIPVTQTAIAIVANPPSLPAHPPCVVSRITGAEVEGVFSGQLTNWRQLKAASNRKAGGDCDQAMTRVVREEDSGTTYQLKHYLDQVNSAPLECTGESPQTWSQLQPSAGGEASPNRNWPRSADCQEGEGPVTVVATSGEGAFLPLFFVAEHPGTITYSGLPEAEFAAPELILDVHNSVKAASPSTQENDANCAAATYELPSAWETGVNVDWSQVYGSNPKIGEVKANAYPICTLSWVVAAADSVGVFGTNAATTVRNYLDYVNATEVGASGRHGNFYRGIPGSVAKAAAVAIAQIGGEEKEEEASGTVLCQAEPEKAVGTLICPEGQTYKGEVRGSLKPKTVATFESTSGPPGVVACSEASLVGEFNTNGTSSEEGGVSQFVFGSGGGGCPSTLEFPEEAEMKVQLENMPLDDSKFAFLSDVAPQASFSLARIEGEPLLFIFGGSTKCHYRLESQGAQVTNGPPTEMLLTASWGLEIGTENCPKSLGQTAELNLDRGKSEADLFIAGE